MEGRKLTNDLLPSPRVRPRAWVRLFVWEANCGVGGCGFPVDGASVAVLDGESVVCGSPAVDARVESNGRGVVWCGGVEGDDGGFASVSPGGVGGGHVVVVVACDGGVFCHGLCLVCVGGLFAGVLDAGAGDPCVGDGSDCVAVWQGDGGGVAASFVGAWLVVEGCVYGDGVRVSRVGGACLARILVVAVTDGLAVAVVVVGLAWREGEDAVLRACDGFSDQHVGECLLFALDPRVDLLLGECDADGSEWLALVAGGGESAGGDVRICCADGGGHGFALVEEDEARAGDGARVVGVGVQVRALDDAAVCVCAHDAPVVCARVFARVAVCEGDGEAGAVAERDDVSVVALHVAAVEEFVEGGGELVCIAGGVGGGSRWRKAVFDVVPRVHLCVFLSVASRLFLFVSLWLRALRARFPVRHAIMGATAARNRRKQGRMRVGGNVTVIERDGCKYADDETMRELLESWDDDDVVCDCFPVHTFVCSIGDGFVAVTHGGRLLSEDDVYDMVNAKLREDYPDPVEIAWLERDVVEVFSRVAPDVYEEYVREEVSRLVENDTLRCLQNWRGPSLARV